MDASSKLCERVVTAAKEKHGLPQFLGGLQVAPCQVGAIDSLLAGVATVSHDPCDRRAIWQRKISLRNDLLEHWVLAGRDHRVHIAKGDIAGLVLPSPFDDARQGIVPCRRIYVRVQHKGTAPTSGFMRVRVDVCRHLYLVKGRSSGGRAVSGGLPEALLTEDSSL